MTLIRGRLSGRNGVDGTQLRPAPPLLAASARSRAGALLASRAILVIVLGALFAHQGSRPPLAASEPVPAAPRWEPRPAAGWHPAGAYVTGCAPASGRRRPAARRSRLSHPRRRLPPRSRRAPVGRRRCGVCRPSGHRRRGSPAGTHPPGRARRSGHRRLSTRPARRAGTPRVAPSTPWVRTIGGGCDINPKENSKSSC